MYAYIHLDGREGHGNSTWDAMADAIGAHDANFILNDELGLMDLEWSHRSHHRIRAVAPAIGRESGEQIGEFHLLWDQPQEAAK